MATSQHDRDYQPTTGDSSRAAGHRFAEALRRFAATDPGGAVVVVSHGGVTVDFLRSVIDDAAWTPRIAQLIGDGVPGGAITEVSLLENDWRLQRLACLDHLADADRSGHRLV